jgi:hypothetical protein
MEGSVQVTGKTVLTDGYYHMIHKDGLHRFYASLSDSIYTAVGRFTKYQVVWAQQFWADGVGNGTPVVKFQQAMEFQDLQLAKDFLARMVNAEGMTHSSEIKSTAPVW